LQFIGRAGIAIPFLYFVRGSIDDFWKSLVSPIDICLHRISCGGGIADLGVSFGNGPVAHFFPTPMGYMKAA